jgi:single-strand DNA-binding protein
MLNRVELIGRLGKDPETRKTGSDKSVTNFSLATSESYKDRTTGEKKETTQWHQIVCWGNLSDIAGRYLGKGHQVYISGKLQTRSYESGGVTKYITEIVCQELILLGQKGNKEGQPVESSGHVDPLGSSPVTAHGSTDDLPF